MAHIQRKCSSCRRSILQGARVCSCGSREATWVARYRGPDHVERSRTFPRKIDAQQFVASEESAKVRGDWIEPTLGRVTLEDFYATWRMKADGLSPTTLDKYERAWPDSMSLPPSVPPP